MDRPKISVIVPVHNSCMYLEQCLDSLTAQSLTGIEIVCVDDGSTDGSTAILQRYASCHDNIRWFRFDEARSASQARKDAVLVSRGEYIMFVDSDDFVEPDACLTAFNSIREKKTDILQFNAVVENCGNLPGSRIRTNQNLLEPYTDGIIRGDLLTECFINNKFRFTLWNKIYSGDLCRRAFSQVADGFFPKANDLYAAYFILKEAQSYSGISKKLYHYCFGRGMTGHDLLSVSDFELCCAGTRVYKAIKAYAESAHIKGSGQTAAGENTNKAKNGSVQRGNTVPGTDMFAEEDAVLEKIRYMIQGEQLSKWKSNVPDSDKREALKVYYEAWDRDPFEAVCSFSRVFTYKKALISKYIDVILQPRTEPHKIKNIAMYYRNIVNGGAQRVVAHLACFFADMDDGKRFNVVLLTDSEPTEDDYPLSNRVTRVVLPDFSGPQNNFHIRGRVLRDVIEKYDIDAVIYSAWNGPVFLWDMLCVKTTAKCPAFFSHMHSYFGVPWKLRQNQIGEMYNSYTYIDGLITLSDYDRNFWKYCNNKIYTIPNPVTDEETHQKNKWHGGLFTVLWTGRIAPEKQPLEVVRIMKYVAEQMPDVVCRILGSGDDEKLNEQLDSFIKDSGLEDRVILEGFHTDVDQFYEKADILLTTSSYEGFPLTVMEAASHGIPTVLYDLPWLEYFKLFQGWEKVGQHQAKEAAGKIIMILSDRDEWEKRSGSLYDSYNAFKAHDFRPQWLKVFADYENGVSAEKITDPEQGVIYRQMINCHGEALEAYAEIVEAKNDGIRRLQGIVQASENESRIRKMRESELESVYNSASWKLGSALIAPLHRLNVLIHKLKG